MNIKTRFALQAGITAVLLIVTLIMVFLVQVKQEKLVGVEHNKLKSIAIAKELTEASQNLTKNCRSYVVTGEKQYLDEYWNIVKWRSGKIPRPATVFEGLYRNKQISEIDIMKELGFTSEELALLGKSAEFSNKLIAVEEQAMNSITQNKFVNGVYSMKDGETIQAFANRIVNDNAYQAEVTKIMTPVNKFFKILNKRLDSAVEEMESRVSSYEKLLIMFIIIVAISIVFMSLYVVRSIVIPIIKVSQSFSVLATGDLTQRIGMDKRTDEIGELSRAIDNFILELSGVIKDLVVNERELNKDSEHLEEISAGVSSNSESTREKANNVAASCGQMSTNVNTIASTAEEMSINAGNVSKGTEEISQNANTLASAVEEMSMSINDVSQNAQETANVTEEATRLSSEANQTIGVLGDAAVEIGKVTEVIKRIAEQTNLLALNATIEAASAGEAGKGFAVVANEIKELASQSAQAAEDIAEKISGVQRNTESAVKVIGEVSEIIGKINVSVEIINKAVAQQATATGDISSSLSETQISIQNIVSNISEVAQGSSDLAKNSSEVAVGAEDVSKNIHAVSELTEENSQGASSVKEMSAKLAGVGKGIKEIADKFKLD